MTPQQVGGALGLSVLVSFSALQANGLIAASVADRPLGDVALPSAQVR